MFIKQKIIVGEPAATLPRTVLTCVGMHIRLPQSDRVIGLGLIHHSTTAHYASCALEEVGQGFVHLQVAMSPLQCRIHRV